MYSYIPYTYNTYVTYLQKKIDFFKLTNGYNLGVVLPQSLLTTLHC